MLCANANICCGGGDFKGRKEFTQLCYESHYTLICQCTTMNVLHSYRPVCANVCADLRVIASVGGRVVDGRSKHGGSRVLAGLNFQLLVVPPVTVRHGDKEESTDNTASGSSSSSPVFRGGTLPRVQ